MDVHEKANAQHRFICIGHKSKHTKYISYTVCGAFPGRRIKLLNPVSFRDGPKLVVVDAYWWWKFVSGVCVCRVLCLLDFGIVAFR